MQQVCKLTTVASLILTGCASSPTPPTAEGPVQRGVIIRGDATTTQREAIVPRDPVARAKFEAALEASRAAFKEEQDRKIEAEGAVLLAQHEAYMQLPESQPILHWWCALNPSDAKYKEEFNLARDKFGIVVGKPERAEIEAEYKRLGYAVLDCSKFAASQARP